VSRSGSTGTSPGTLNVRSLVPEGAGTCVVSSLMTISFPGEPETHGGSPGCTRRAVALNDRE